MKKSIYTFLFAYVLLLIPFTANASIDPNGFASITNYFYKDSAKYRYTLYSYYRQLRSSSTEELVKEVSALRVYCAEHACDGLQPIALALSDLLANGDIGVAQFNESITPLFSTMKFSGGGSLNMPVPVLNSKSPLVRSMRVDAVQAMFERFQSQLLIGLTKKMEWVI